MSKDQYDTHLKYGQGILIQGYKQKANDLGFLTAKGFADIKAKYQTYDNILYFKNYRNAIFQMLPAGNFELNDELHKALIQNQGKQETPNIKILKARAKSQEVQFQLNIDKQIFDLYFSKNKNLVCFGNSVIFKHIDSGTYISGTIRPSSGSNGAFTVEVSNNLSQSLIFKLLPYRSFEFLGMPIPFDSPIILKNQYNNGFLTFQKLGLYDNTKQKGMYIEKKPIQSDQSYKIPVKTQSSTSQVYECVTHFVDLSVQKQVPMPWKFVLHFNDVDNDCLIQHDIVYLEHTQNNGVLSMDKGEIILKEMKEVSENPGLKFYECLWELEKHDQTDDSYILRHLMSGQTLGIQYQPEFDRNDNEVLDEDGIPVQRPAYPILIDISGGQKPGAEFGVVELKLAKKQGGEIESNSHINVAWGDYILETEEEVSALNVGSQEFILDEIIDKTKMRRKLKQEVQFKTRKLVFRQNAAQEHCFVIQEIDNDLKKDVLFALSFHSVIINLREDLKWGAIEAAKKIDYFRMMKVTEKIRQIKDFLKNCSNQESDLEHIFPIQKCQMICKDLGISELLFELLFYMKMNIKEDIFSDKHNERQKFLELYNTLYQVIRELIRFNKLFKMHISKWILFVFQDVVSNNQETMQKMLIELLKENEFFVQQFVTEKLLKYLTEEMLNRIGQSPIFVEKKYLEILRLFCITGNSVNTANQICIYRTFIQALNEQRGSVLNFQITNHRDQILIKSAIDKSTITQMTFKEFYETCKKQNESAWQYFVEYLNLIADMTQGRNKVTENQLAKQFNLQLVTNIFQNEQLHEAEVPILRIIHYLYAQSERFYPVERNNKIINYNKLNEGYHPTIISTPSVVKPWEPPFDRVLKVLVEKLRACTAISSCNYKENKTVYQLLNFIWETLNLGFWQQKDQVKDILTSVLKILETHQDNDYQSAKKPSSQNNLMLKCKLQCLKIIQLITDYDQDLFVQTLSINFKEFPMPERKRGLQTNDMSSLLSLKGDNQISLNFIHKIPDENQIQPLIETNIIDTMIQLSKYNNPQLTSKALGIIEHVLQTKKKALDHFSGQRMICQEETLKFVQYIQKVRNSFFILEDPNLTNIDQQSQHDNYFLVYQQGNKNNLMTTLYQLSQLMKNQNDISRIDKMETLENSGCYEYLGGEKLLNFTMERSSTNLTKQNIVFCSNLHPKVTSYIFNCKQIPESPLAKKLLHLCYKFIVALIQNYNQIKIIMVQQIPKMIHHISQNVGCVDFLKEMYDNNKNMLYNEAEVFSLIKFMCDTIENQPSTSYYKSKLLDFFRYLIYCNGRSLKFIQIQILKIMQDDTYKNIILGNDALNNIPELVNEYIRANEGKQAGQFIEMGPQLTYMTTFFQISASLIDDNNTVNMGKIIKRFPFDKLVVYLKQSSECWPLKRNIRTLINRLYYFQPEIQTILKVIMEEDFENIISDLNTYIKIKTLPNSKQKQNLEFQSPVRFSYLESYLYLNLEEIFFTIFQLVTRQACVNDLTKFLNIKDSPDGRQYIKAYKFIRICQRLAWIRLFFTQNKNVYSNSMLKFIIKKISIILFNLDLDVYKTKFEEEKTEIINKILAGTGINLFFQEQSRQVQDNLPLVFSIPNKVQQIKQEKAGDRERLLQKLRKILKRQKKDFETEDEKVTYFMNKLINSLKLSPRVDDFFYEQFKNKVSNYTRKQASIYSYITSIIQMNSSNPEALPTHLKTFFLELITFIVQQKNSGTQQKAQGQAEQQADGQPKDQNLNQQKQGQQEPLIHQKPQQHGVQGQPVQQQSEQSQRIPIDEWEPENWQKNQKQIRKTQNELKKCDLSKFIVDLLKQNITENVKFANSILLCAISYLLGGNNLTQKSIIEELMKDQENKVFRNIQQLIANLGKLILKNITQNTTQQQTKKQNDFCPTTVDNYDYFDVNQRYCCRKNVFEPNSTDEYLYHQLCITTYRRAFKFLQLLCENNNIEGKHFIREQSNSKRQVNFINVTTKQLRNLFTVMCKEIIDVPIFLLEFILEVTQIPVKENQQVLMRSTFFEDLCQMENFFSKPQNLELRNLNYEEDKAAIDQIFFKSVQIILSNFEGNDAKTFSSLDSKIQQKFLTNILKQKLLANNIQTKQNLTNHIKEYCNQEDQEGRKITTFSQPVMEILNIMIIFEKMKDRLGDKSRIRNSYQKFKKQQKSKWQQLRSNRIADGMVEDQQQQTEYKCPYAFLEKCIIKIQITDSNNQQQTVYFPKHPVFNSLSSNLRDYVMKQVDRNTHRDKIVSLLGFVGGVREKIQYSYNLQKKQKITEANMNFSYNIAALFSIIICAYMMYFYQIVVEYQAAEFTSNYAVGSIKFILSLIQLGTSLVYTYYWIKLKIWYKPIRQSRNPSQNESKPQQESKQEGQPGTIGKIKLKIGSIYQSFTGFAFDKLVIVCKKVGFEIDPESQQQFYYSGFYPIAMFVLCSFIGTFFYPIFFFVHLIDIFCKIEILANIFRAVANNIKSLIFVSFMGVVFVFIFCTVTFSNYMKNVYSENQSIDEMCDDIVGCVMSLYVSGAVSETMESFQLQRFTYDMIYGTFFGLLFGNIVQGIMLDSFSSLRQQNQALDDDKSNRCYICSMKRQVMQKKGQSFKDHTLNKHFLWNYVFYIIALERKSGNDYTGLQYEISQKYNLPDEQMIVTWVPSKGESMFDIKQQAKALTQDVQKKNQQLGNKVSELQGKIQQFNKLALEYV